jgi:hypothetical protein
MDPNFHVSEYGIGSETIFNTFNSNGIFAELYLDCEMEHGLDNDDACGTCTLSTDPFKKPGTGSTCLQCSYQSNFGTNANSEVLTYDYLASRVATFFQAILTGKTGKVMIKKFVEIQDNYYDVCNNTDPNTQGTNPCDLNHHLQ